MLVMTLLHIERLLVKCVFFHGCHEIYISINDVFLFSYNIYFPFGKWTFLNLFKTQFYKIFINVNIVCKIHLWTLTIIVYVSNLVLTNHSTSKTKHDTHTNNNNNICINPMCFSCESTCQKTWSFVGTK